MINKVRRSLNISKLQFFVAIAGLLIAGSALYHFTLGSQVGLTSNPSIMHAQAGNDNKTPQSQVLAATTGSVPGLVLIWGSSHENSTVQNNAWLHAGQIVFNWASAEPNQGSFPDWTGNGNSLDSQLALYYAAGKTTTIQVNADSFPSWIVNTSNTGSLVDYCGYRSLSASGQGGTATVPAYWYNAGSDGLNPAYKSAMSAMLNSLATAIANSPYKSAVLGIRTGYDLIGTEHYQFTGDSAIHPVSPLPAQCNGWTSTIGDEAAGTALYLNYQAFSGAGVHTLLRTTAANISVGPGKYFAQDGGFSSTSNYLSPSKAWLFLTNADPDQGQNNLANYVPIVKSGSTIGYAEQYNDATLHNDPLSWEWWRELMDVSRGTSYIATYYADVSNTSIANNFFNQPFFQNFVNSYAGTNNTAAEASSPGAWVAFAPSSSPFGGNLGLFMSQTSQTNTTGYDSSLGTNILGSGQPYGRYATKINPGGSVTLTLDSAFPRSGSATITVWYYDSGSGSWTINGGSVNQTISKPGSGIWKTASFTSSSIPGTITLSAPSNASTGTYFHMVEMVKGGSVATCSSNPAISLTSPSNGATVSGSGVAISANASAAANCTLSQVAFSVNSTSIATLTHSPYSANWDSTTVSDGSYTITATATDTSGHSASTGVLITVSNSTNPGGGGPGPGGGSGPVVTVGSGGTVAITPNTTTQVNGTVTLAPTLTPLSNSADYVIKTVYYLDSKLLATETETPFSYHLNTTNYINGTYTLTVRTYYASGAITTSTQKLVIDNPLSLKQIGLLLVHYAMPISIVVIIILGLSGFLLWWVRFHSPSGTVAIVLTNIGFSIRRFFANFPPWSHGPGYTDETSSGGQADDQIPTYYDQSDGITGPTLPNPGEVIEPDIPTDIHK